MTRREQYGLTFYKLNLHGEVNFFCSAANKVNTPLTELLSHLSVSSANGFGYEITQAMDNLPYQSTLSTDSHEGMDIEIIPPNLIISGFSIPLLNAAELLAEWIEYVEAN